MLAGVLSLFGRWSLATSAFVVALIDFYMFFLVIAAALRGDKPGWLRKKPRLYKLVIGSIFHRVTAIWTVTSIAASIILLFASMYIASNDVILTSTHERISSPLDACYFSFVTLATVGFGDFAPGPGGTARLIVIYEIVNSMLLLVVGLPLAISHILDRSDKMNPANHQV